MGLLYLLSYLCALVGFIFVTLSLASGLLWIAEMIEEHSRVAKTVGQRAIWVIIAVHLALCFDSLPLPHLLFSICAHIVYSLNITSRWPIISLMSPTFILSCILVCVDHFVWFNYFSHLSERARQRNRYNYGRPPPPGERNRGFGEVATFFFLCVWLIPLFLFLSLSANDNALPTSATLDTSSISTRGVTPTLDNSRKKRTALLRRILGPVMGILPGTRRQEPLIVAHTPHPSSPYPASTFTYPETSPRYPPPSPVPASTRHADQRAPSPDPSLTHTSTHTSTASQYPSVSQRRVHSPNPSVVSGPSQRRVASPNSSRVQSPSIAIPSTRGGSTERGGWTNADGGGGWVEVPSSPPQGVGLGIGPAPRRVRVPSRQGDKSD